MRISNEVVCLALRLSGVVLLVVGLAKLVGQTQTLELLGSRDPIFPMTIRQVLLTASIIEIVIGLICIRNRDELISSICITWFCTAAIIYRFGMNLVAYSKPCNCLGGLTEVLGLSDRMADILAQWIIGFLLIAGVCGLLKQLLGERMTMLGVRKTRAMSL